MMKNTENVSLNLNNFVIHSGLLMVNFQLLRNFPSYHHENCYQNKTELRITYLDTSYRLDNKVVFPARGRQNHNRGSSTCFP